MGELLVNRFQGILLLRIKLVCVALCHALPKDLVALCVGRVEGLAFPLVFLRDFQSGLLVGQDVAQHTFEAVFIRLFPYILCDTGIFLDDGLLVGRQVGSGYRRAVKCQALLLCLWVGVLPFEFFHVPQPFHHFRLPLYVGFDKAFVVQLVLCEFLFQALIHSVDTGLLDVKLRLPSFPSNVFGIFLYLLCAFGGLNSNLIVLLLFTVGGCRAFGNTVSVDFILCVGYVPAYLGGFLRLQLRLRHSIQQALLLLFVVLPILFVLHDLRFGLFFSRCLRLRNIAEATLRLRHGAVIDTTGFPYLVESVSDFVGRVGICPDTRLRVSGNIVLLVELFKEVILDFRLPVKRPEQLPIIRFGKQHSVLAFFVAELLFQRIVYLVFRLCLLCGVFVRSLLCSRFHCTGFGGVLRSFGNSLVCRLDIFQ